MSNYTSNTYVKDVNTPWYKIIQQISKGSTVLDIGCSSGNLGQAIIQETGSAVTGVEIDEADAKKAAKVLSKVYTANLETDPIPNELAQQKFDYIVFCDVIEHFFWPAQTLTKLRPLLKPNGKILFSIPNMAHMSVRLMLLRGSFTYGETGLLDKTHLHFYDEDEIHRVFQEAGYSIDRFDWVSRDFPEPLLKSELKKMGLTADQKFLAIRNEIAAGAYQYVGVASVADKPAQSKKRAYVSPDVHEVEEYIKNVRDQLHGELQVQLEAQSQEKDKALQKLNETEIYARDLQQQIKLLKNSKSYKLIQKTKAVARRRKA